ncbi:MAG: RNA 2'-phosphotransferase [Polyangiaceae bacterium]
MDEKQRTRISKFLSFVLRHEPASIGIALDAAGWVDVDALLRAAADHGQPLTRDELSLVVATSPKRRFAFSEDGSRIRANQGHTTQVDLGYEPAEPPAVLFHGTVKRFLSQIREHGLLRMDRHHVHLSADEATAHAVGSRRGKPVILRVDAQAMRNAGHVFFVAPNGVWLTEAVPSEFLSGLESG